MATRTLAQRMTVLERELARLKQQVQESKQQDTNPRLQQIVGVFKGDPLFDEAERIGREWRDSQP